MMCVCVLHGGNCDPGFHSISLYLYIYIYVYMYVCVCVCVCITWWYL